MHPTNNRRSPEWFPWSKIVITNTSATWFWQNNQNTSATWFRRNNPKNQNNCRRHVRRKYRLWQPWRNKTMVFGVLSLAPCYSGKFELQVRRADQALYPITSGSFVGRGPWLYATSPCFNKPLKFYIFTDETHTHSHTHTYHLCFNRHGTDET